MTDQPRIRRVAAFDFDGTLTRRDTLVPFLAKVAGSGRLLRSASSVGLDGIRGKIPLRDRDKVKEAMIHELLAGRSESDMRRLGSEFADEILTNRMNGAVLGRLREHLAERHQVILVSASLVHYLDPIAEHLGLDAVIAVEPTVIDGVLDGTLARPNVRAEQKAVRLREWLSSSSDDNAENPDVELWAYGNSSGDLALLAAADHAYWLGRPGKVPPGSEVFQPMPLIL